jgi:cytochrome c biogenesis protein CcmG, thiol:disulfide interchange protein DsbE
MSATRTTPHKGKGRQGAPRKPVRTKRSPVLPIAIGLFVLLALVAIVASMAGSGDDGDTTSPAGDDGPAAIEEVRDVEVTGTALADYEDGNDAALGVPAPVLEGQTFDGAGVTIGEKGRPQLVFFVAHWCPHCQKEVPVISEWLDEAGEPDDVVLRAVSTGVNKDAPNYPPSEWLDREGWPVKTLADDADSTAAKAFGLSAYPFFVALNADGEVVARTSGELTVPQLEALLEAARG